METNAITCTGTWYEDHTTTYKVIDLVTPCLTVPVPSFAVLRCSGCTDRMVIIDGKRVDYLESAATDHPDYVGRWIDDIAIAVERATYPEPSAEELAAWEAAEAACDADEAAFEDACREAEADYLNGLAAEDAFARDREYRAYF